MFSDDELHVRAVAGYYALKELLQNSDNPLICHNVCTRCWDGIKYLDFETVFCGIYNPIQNVATMTLVTILTWPSENADVAD